MAFFDSKISDEDLRTIVNVRKETRSNQYICDCIFCGKENHMYISKLTQRWDCKRCGESGGIYKLLKHVDKLYLLGASTIKFEHTIKSIRDIQEEQAVDNGGIEVEELPEVTMPAGFREYDYLPPYLQQRGLSMFDIKHYHIGYTKIVSRFIDYILIPIYDNSVIRGYIGRYAGKHIPDGKLRYANSLNTDFGSLLFGYDDIVSGKTDTIIITEGLFDAISVTKKINLLSDSSVRCVCTFGKKISQIQINKLLLKSVRRVVLLYDYDALREIKHYSAVLNEYFDTKVAVALDKKDIDECSVNEVIDVFNNMKSVKDFYLDIVGKPKR